MKKHILCFGDSNTHGYCPVANSATAIRFDESVRWTTRLQAKLGAHYLVIEEGCSGRTTVFDDPLEYGLCGLEYLYPCLKSHAPVDLLIIMLGTNDTKERFGANAFVIGKGMERLIRTAQQMDYWGDKKPNILLMAPPAIGEGIFADPKGMGVDCVEKSRQVPGIFQDLATMLGCHYLDVGALGCAFNDIDYMHLTADAHGLLAEKLAEIVPTLV